MDVPSLRIQKVNQANIVIGEFTFYYSYKTLIGFHSPKTGYLKRENEWGPTTGKHLNAIPGEKRIPGGEFLAKVREALRGESL